MITNVQIFTTQLTVSQYKISSLPIFLFTVTLNIFIKWLAASGAFLFGKHCGFLEGIACLCHGMTFSGAAVVCRRALSFNYFRIWVPSEIWLSRIDWRIEFCLWTSVSLLTLAAEAFPSYTPRNLFAVGLMVPDFVCWAPHHKWGPVCVQPRAPLSRDQGASLVTTCTWPCRLSEILSLITLLIYVFATTQNIKFSDFLGFGVNFLFDIFMTYHYTITCRNFPNSPVTLS